MTSHVSRKRFAAGSAAAFASIALLPSRVRAADFNFKFGTDTPVDHPSNVDGLKAFDQIRKETNGRVDIQLFPNNELGGATQMLTQVRAGAMTFQLIDGVTLGSVVDLCGIQGVGFAFKNTAAAFVAMDGDLGAAIRKEIEAKDMYVHPRMFLNGMRQVTASPRAIVTPDDLSNFKIRTPPAKMSLDLFKSLGASPTPMNFNEVYTSLQTHVVDGQENPLAVIELAKLFEVQKYLSVTSHMWSAFWLIGNADAWKSLPPDLQATVARNFESYALAQRKDTDLLNTTLVAKLQSQGMAVNKPDPAAFRAKLGPFYQRWKAEFGDSAWSLLEKYTGKLA